LILFVIENVADGQAEKIRLEETVAGSLPAGSSFIPVSPLEGYVFVPHCTENQGRVLAEKVKAALEQEHASLSVAAGICRWPFHGNTKTETTVNCRKALMHGRFFGPGAVTVFDHVSLNVSGDYLFDEGDYRQAVRDYRAGVGIARDDFNLMNSLGVALTALNRLHEAVVCFDRVVKKDPENFMALVNMGFVQRMLGDKGEALRCFEQASRHREFAESSVFPDLSLQLGRLYCDAGRFDRALDILHWYEKHPGSRQEYSLYSLLGEAYAEKKQPEQAIPALQKAVRKNPHDARSLSLLGELYAGDGQGDDIALALCRQAVDRDDTSWQHWFRLALVSRKMGRLQEAGDAVKESLRRNRGAVDALFLAGQIHRDRGEEQKARGKFQRVLKRAPGHSGALKAIHHGKKNRRGRV
jgi:tetratricopeptide (TPR) repeat protein